MLQNTVLNFTCQGKVISGEKVGRTIGFPTANLDYLPTEKELAPGVYGAEVKIKDSAQQYHSLVYFGPRFIFGEIKPNFEVYLLDFSGDLYGQILEVELTTFIREPYQLKNLTELKKQLETDLAVFKQKLHPAAE